MAAFCVDLSSAVNLCSSASASALAASLSASDFESEARLAAESAVNCSYSACASFSSVVICVISLSKSVINMLIISTTPACSCPFLAYASQVSGGGGGATAFWSCADTSAKTVP